MQQIRKRLTYANVMSSIAVFLVLGGATAFAATKLAKNSVGTKQLKPNSVTTAKIKKNAVTAAKIKNNAVTGAKVQVSSLGKVPSASVADTATTATNLAGQQAFFVRLNPGQSQTIATNGSVSLVAQCATGVEGTSDRVRILGQTTLSGAILDGNSDLSGPGGNGKFLESNTPEDERALVTFQDTTGDIDVSARIDQGYVLGPDGNMITVNSEGIALGLNYGGSTCLAAGIVNLISG